VLFRNGGSHPELQAVFNGGAAHKAGLSAGDTLLALDGLRLNASDIDSALQRYRPDDEVLIHAFRRDELMSFRVRLQPAEKNVCYLRFDAQADAVRLRLRKAWLSPSAAP
jgi:predicted metalloprotease with PDZ domain